MLGGVFDGRVLQIHWFEENGICVSVNGDSYLDMMKSFVWPSVSRTAKRKKFWFQQDGAPCHCTNRCLQFLNDKFENRVISHRSEFIWPAHSPDLNPLDYWFWGQVEREVSSGLVHQRA